MPACKKSKANRSGFSLLELAIVLGVVGILAAVAVPLLFNAIQSSTAKAGAEEIRQALAQAKQLAVRTRIATCVAVPAANQYQFMQPNCAGAVVAGPFMVSSTAVNLGLPGGAPVFNWLGMATPPGGAIGIITVTVQGTVVRNVAVGAGGQISIN